MKINYSNCLNNLSAGCCLSEAGEGLYNYTLKLKLHNRY